MKSFKNILDEIKEAWLMHESEASKFRRLYETALHQHLINEDFASVSDEPIEKVVQETLQFQERRFPSRMNEVNNPPNSKATFEEVILQIFNDTGTPMHGGELLDEFYKRTGRKLNRKNFSSKTAITAKTKKSIKNQEFKEFPNHYRFWWGLTEWFDGNEFSNDFKEKIMIKADKERSK
jgi:hypothetical protein